MAALRAGEPTPMLALLATLKDIVLCRRGPEDLPASQALLLLLVLVYVVLNYVQAGLSGWTLPGVTPLIAVEVAMLLAWVWVLLAFFGRRPRYRQTMSAVLGIAMVLTSLDIALLLLDRVVAVPEAFANTWSVVRLFVMVLLVGRVLKIAIEGGMLTGFAFTMMMVLSIIYVGQMFVPGG